MFFMTIKAPRPSRDSIQLFVKAGHASEDQEFIPNRVDAISVDNSLPTTIWTRVGGKTIMPQGANHRPGGAVTFNLAPMIFTVTNH